MLLLLAPSIDAEGQGDPYCHVEVVSGSPALFQLNTVDELTAGKSLYYSTCLALQFTQEPKEWYLHLRPKSEFFDGAQPNSLSCQVINVKVEQVCLNTPGNVLGAGMRQKYSSSDISSGLSPVDNTVANGWFSGGTKVDVFTIYVYLRFEIRPKEYDAAKLVDKPSGYYLNEIDAYVEIK
ncbi:MAG: hypothetical protein MJZ61_08395 [Bacteroidales bacterium]|nr:hypothetical protein [Bacteroidales bacterium]